MSKAKNVVFLVHGMGKHARGDEEVEHGWAADAIRAFEEMWQLFPRLKNYKMSDFIDFVPLGYDHVFNDYLAGLGGEAEAIKKVVPESKFNLLLDALGDADDDDASFFWTHVSDVILYRFGADLYRAAHVALMEQIVETVQDYWDTRGSYDTTFSMVTHSLGTAVAHGALNRLGGSPINGSEAFTIGGQLQFRTYVTLANVSRLLWYGEQDIYNSTVVRPYTPSLGPGYVDNFINVRHGIDPVPAVRRFSPSNWGQSYGEVVVRHLHRWNVHDFDHYVAHPRVAGNIFRSILGEYVVPEMDIDTVLKDFPEVKVDQGSIEQATSKIDEWANALNRKYGDDRVTGTTISLLAKACRELIERSNEIKPWWGA